jgi:hypothetical protein
MGFDQAFGQRMSLGLLHLGYALEDAAGRGVAEYDFLAGAGRHTQYKTNLAQKRTLISTTQLVLKSWLSMFYRVNDFIKLAT